VITQPVGQRLDQVRPAAGAGFRESARHGLTHGDDVIAVDLLALDAGGNRLLRQGLGSGLLGERHRDSPPVVVDDKDDRQLADAGNIKRFGDIAFRGRPVAKDADGDPLFAPQLECQRHPDRVRRVGADGNANREILPGLREIAASLVAAPEQEQLDGADAAPQLRAMLAEARQQQILGPHGACDPDGDRLLAERRGKGAEPPGSLQRHRLGVETPRQHHPAVERDQLVAVPGKIGQRSNRASLRVEKAAVADLEPRHRGRQRRSRRVSDLRPLLGCIGERHCTPNGITLLSGQRFPICGNARRG
jgi:hypothetical protein